MEWTAGYPAQNGTYGYRHPEGHVAPTFVHVELADPPVQAPDGRAYFPKDATGTHLADMPGEWCGPFTLPE